MMRLNASLVEAVWLALRSIKGAKLRSFLTLLGIILATATLIAVMSIIHGMDVYIAENISDMGAEGFRVERFPEMGRWDPKRWQEMLKRNPELNEEEFQYLRTSVRLSREIGMRRTRTASVKYGRESIDEVTLLGVTPNMAVITNVKTAQGRFLSDMEDQGNADVVFLGNDLTERFFTGRDPVNRTIFIDGRPFRVVGAAKAQGSVFGRSQDKFVMIPIHTYFRRFGGRTGMSYAALAQSRAQLYSAQEEVRTLMRIHRHLGPTQDDNFGLHSSDSMVSNFDQATSAFAATAVAIVSVFLVVGGVVIMNIMLAAVTERTHEIGIRKSVGARRSDILWQFLVESSMLAASGGALGVLTAWVFDWVVATFTPVPMAMPPSAVIVGVGTSAVVGLFFGIYPARRAAMLDPIEALRMEK